MRDTLHESLRYLKKIKIRKNRMFAVLMVLSFVVSVDVFWILCQPGLAMAGDATCGIQEHHHDETCGTQTCICEIAEEDHTHEETCFAWDIGCGLEEHSHEISCYSDVTADVETMLDWQEMFASYPYTGNLREDLAGIARTQVGYSESELNFEVGTDGVRRGYTRYGAWYGIPYGDWSAMFVSFCLNYAGADPAETPGNTGADAMAQLWDNLDRYAPAGRYSPEAGDLVFFNDNTVGIVTEVQNASFYAICGDVDGTVSGKMLSLNDPSVDGWGLTEGTVSELSMPLMMTMDEDDTEGTDGDEDEVVDLMDYLEDCEGTYSFVLKDDDDQEVTKENGKYVVFPNIEYDLVFTIHNPLGFEPGVYTYQIPNGELINNGTGAGEFKLDSGDIIGSWTVDDRGVITLVFNKEADRFSKVTISSEMGIVFPMQDEPIDFDGNITVKVEKPPEKQNPTTVYKWGSQGGPDSKDGPDETKLYWTVQMLGNKDSDLAGSRISDQLMKTQYVGTQTYTESDMENGLHVIAAQKDPVTGHEFIWHTWDVYPGDPNLIWTESGWSYKLPEVADCDCHGTVTLGNADWNYMVKFTSTPEPVDVNGALDYWNDVRVDGVTSEGWVKFYHSEVEAKIDKHGVVHGDADGGIFLWEIDITIPGMDPGEKADYWWYIIDNMRVRDDGWNTVGRAENDVHNAVVTATGNGINITVPNVSDAEDDDQVAWYLGWSSPPDENGTYYGRSLDFICRCNCTEDNCQHWKDGKCAVPYWAGEGFCLCWTVEQDLTFTVSYSTNDPEIIDKYGGMGYLLQNQVTLHKMDKQPDGSWGDSNLGYAEAEALIPGMFKKELMPELDGYIANYVITVNEAKLVLTDGTPLTIHDEMSETLAFINGSLVITTEDAEGNIGTLQQGVDYTVTYDGSGGELNDDKIPVHVLEIEIKNPQPVKYILDYDAALIIPEGTTSPVRYTNFAYVTLWGQKMTDDTPEKLYANLNIAAKNYGVDLLKKDNQTGEPLGGALFGLFNGSGGMISSDVTDDNGKLRFETAITEGIILQDHELYYLQELKAPLGYQLDDEPHWFCFCDKTTAECAECDAVMGDLNGVRIPHDTIGKVGAVNERINYHLPATGGTGIYTIVMVSVILIITSLIYGLYRRCKRERRNVG